MRVGRWFAVVFLCLAANFGAKAQWTVEYDTIKISTRVLGTTDSIDYNAGELPTTFDGGRSILSLEGLSAARLVNDYRGFRFGPSPGYRPLRFSALPYLGFSYSFGGQGAQSVDAQYAHAFTDSLVLNIDYSRRSAAGYLRNTAFTRNRVRMQLQRIGHWYTFQLKGTYRNDSLFHSGGVVNDTIVGTLGLEFASVWKSNASSNAQEGTIDLDNYFRLNEGENYLGIVTRHSYGIFNRRFKESDTLYALYPNVFIDSNNTFDRYNWAHLTNEGGLFFKSPRGYVDGRIAHTFWDYKNLSNTLDTSEINLRSNLDWRFGGIRVKNELDFNLIGGFNELSDRASIRFKQGSWGIMAYLAIENTAPIPVKRSYFSNQYQTNLENIILQKTQRFGGTADYSQPGKNTLIQLSANFARMDDIYTMDDTSWILNEVEVNALELKARASFEWGGLNVQPDFVYTVQPQNYLPDFQARMRLFYRARLFKAKKLIMHIGTDASYISGFTHRVYNPIMDNFFWHTTAGSMEAQANLHFFTTLQIDDFRFYFRFENIGYFWNNRLAQEVNGYPIAGTRLKLGITWDFFN